MNVTDWAEAWFKPEVVLPAAAKHTATGLFAVDWLPYMLTGELLISALMGKHVYNLRQLICNLSMPFFFHLVARLGLRAMLVLPYTYIYQHYRLVEWDSKHAWWMHLLALVVCDLCTYWVHRAMHEWNIGWAGHVPHHSSMDYNMSVGVRGGAFDIAHFGWVTYLPLALVCPSGIYLAHRTSNFVYSVFMHTKLVGKLWAPVEFIMNTPSHHRVHHARNYGRKNFGDVLIVWDRLFGTFQAERDDRPCVYGLNAQPVVQGTYNPLWQQVHHFVATVELAASGTVPVSKALFSRVTGPGMVAPSITAALEEPAGGKKRGRGVEVRADASTAATKTTPGGRAVFDAEYPWEKRAWTALDFYAAFQLFCVLNPFMAFLKAQLDLTIPQIVVGSILAAWGATTVAWQCGATTKAMKHELFRLVVQGVIATHFLQTGGLDAAAAKAVRGVAALTAASFAFILSQLVVAGRQATVGESTGKKVA